MEFAVGDTVEKIGGRCGGPGRIAGVADDFGDGHVLYLVAHRIEGGFGVNIDTVKGRGYRLLPAVARSEAA